jgi:hypothetical protein
MLPLGDVRTNSFCVRDLPCVDSDGRDVGERDDDGEVNNDDAVAPPLVRDSDLRLLPSDLEEADVRSV